MRLKNCLDIWSINGNKGSHYPFLFWKLKSSLPSFKVHQKGWMKHISHLAIYVVFCQTKVKKMLEISSMFHYHQWEVTMLPGSLHFVVTAVCKVGDVPLYVYLFPCQVFPTSFYLSHPTQEDQKADKKGGVCEEGYSVIMGDTLPTEQITSDSAGRGHVPIAPRMLHTGWIYHLGGFSII